MKPIDPAIIAPGHYILDEGQCLVESSWIWSIPVNYQSEMVGEKALTLAERCQGSQRPLAYVKYGIQILPRNALRSQLVIGSKAISDCMMDSCGAVQASADRTTCGLCRVGLVPIVDTV